MTLSVLPRLLTMRRIQSVRGIGKTPYPMMDLARMGVANTDFKEIRQYVPGDPVRLINWKATGRSYMTGSGQPLVNQFEFEGKKAIWLFLDSSQYMDVGTTLRSPLENSIEAAAGLGFYYLSRGYVLGAHFSSRPDTILIPDTGKRQFSRLVHELVALKATPARYDLPQAIQLCRAQLIRYSPQCIVVTRLDATVHDLPGLHSLDQKMVQGMRELQALSLHSRARPSVWVIAVNAYHYAEGSTPVTQLGGTLRALETRPVKQGLRRMGISVLDWNPSEEEFAQALMRQKRTERT
jgi:uncharacterized protein (DUF58 family)